MILSCPLPGLLYRLIWPPIKYIEPGFRKTVDILHNKGKYLLTHTDGKNTGLLQHYLDSRIDVADSICPKPMTKLSFQEVRDKFDSRITIIGGIPSVALMETSMSDKEFDGFINSFFEEIGDGTHLILGISDTTPPGAEFDRILKITELAKQFGQVPRAKNQTC